MQVVTGGNVTYDARRLQLGVAQPGNPVGCPDVRTFDSKSYEIVTPAVKLRMFAGMVIPGAILTLQRKKED